MGTASQTLLSPTIIAREGLRLLKNNLVMGNAVYRAYEAEFPGNPRKGGTVTIRKPVKFTVTKTRTRTSQFITEQSITLTVATQAHVSWAFNMKDLTLTIEEYSDRYIRPAASVLANTVDGDLCALYDDIWNVVHETTTGWVNPETFMCLGQAMQRLDEEACPPEDRCVVLNPAGHWSMANALAALGIPNIPEKAIRKGYLGTIANADIFMDQNVKVHTVGNWATASDAMSSAARFKVHTTADSAAGGGLPTGNVVGVTANQRIHIDGFLVGTTVVLKVGDTFTIDGCYAVNPMSGESTGSLRSFVVTADAYGCTASCLEDIAVVYFQPDMIHTGPYKTVDTIPQLSAPVTIFGVPKSKIPQNLAFHKNAFALVMVPLEKPDGQWGSTVTEDGYSIRIVKAYDIENDDEIIRLDILYGVKTIYPELAVRIAGAKQGGF